MTFLSELFSKASISEAEKFLKSWDIKFKRQSDGIIFVPGDIDVSQQGLRQLPDLSMVKVGGSFLCDYNGLTSLQGAPYYVGHSFSCHGNKLTSLKGAPTYVRSSFWCSDNSLNSLEYSPFSVGEGFYCTDNNLISLEHAPGIFKILHSDFGIFETRSAIPDYLRRHSEATEKRNLGRYPSAVRSAIDATLANHSLRIISR